MNTSELLEKGSPRERHGHRHGQDESVTVKALTISCSAARCEMEQVLEIKGDEDFAAIWRSWVTPQIRRRT